MADQKVLKTFVDDSIRDSIQEMKDSLSKDFADIRSLLMELVGKKATTSTPHRDPATRMELRRFRGGNPEAWVLEAERYFEFYSIADEFKLSLASSYLDVEALEWFRWLYQNKQFVDWKHFTKKLRLDYRK
ncbi:hypothetical protein A4A49_58387, partial [Nicotiana attenuata]